jgi:hypothetical protein
MKNRLVISLIILGLSSLLPAQDTVPASKYFVHINMHYGFIAAHNPNMLYLIKRHIPAGELFFMQQTNGEKYWEQLYKNPEKGIGIYFADLGNPNELGQVIGLFPFVNFPLNPNRKFKLYFRVGDGLAFTTKPYNRITNYKNNIYSSLLNAFIVLRFNSVFYPAKNIRMETGIGLSHFSNGAWSVPNKGANLITLNLGVGLKNKERTEPLPSIPKEEKIIAFNSEKRNWWLETFFTAGLAEEGRADGRKYGVYAITTNLIKPVLQKSRFYLGTDMFYNFSNLAIAKRDTLFDTTNKLNNLQMGARIGYELVVGKLALPIEMGVYFFSKITYNGPFYHRIGIRYYVNKHLILNYSLKTHWATAENIELGLGYRFCNRYSDAE